MNKLQILYEDNHLLAVSKVPGMLTQPAQNRRVNLEDEAKAWLKKKYNKKGNVFLHAVHRLDRVTGGIVLFAKTEKALKRLNKAMRARQIRKVYHAGVKSGNIPETGKLTDFLRHSSHHADISHEGDGQAREAGLEYRIIKKSGDIAIVEIVLLTGRYHQIRIQFANAGMPIIGDTLYGGPSWGKNGIMLRHVEMSFLHPVTQKMVVIKENNPKDWEYGYILKS